MVKLSIDTNTDNLGDLEEAVEIIQEAVTRRRATEAIERGTVAEKVVQETAVDTPFFKITVESEETLGGDPTLNELLTNESITESELQNLFELQGIATEPAADAKKKQKKKKSSDDEFIEIVDFEEED